MEHKSNKCNSIGTNRTIGTNGRVEWTPTQPEAIGNILSLYKSPYGDISPMDYQWTECHSIGLRFCVLDNLPEKGIPIDLRLKQFSGIKICSYFVFVLVPPKKKSPTQESVCSIKLYICNQMLCEGRSPTRGQLD